LDIDLDDSLHAPEIEAKLAETKDQEWKAIVNMKDELIKSRMRLGVAARLVVEIIAPELSKGVFIRVLHKKYHQSVEFAEEYLYQVIKRSFPDDHNRIPAIGIESIFADPNKLYLIITDEFIGINKAYDLYEVSKYDPEKFITPVYSEPDEKGNLVDKTMPHHEYISEISKWLLDMDTEIKKKIATIEMWLDKQDLDNN
jgi:hypothetical protein